MPSPLHICLYHGLHTPSLTHPCFLASSKRFGACPSTAFWPCFNCLPPAWVTNVSQPWELRRLDALGSRVRIRPALPAACQPPASVRPTQEESPTCAAPSPWSPCGCRTYDWPAAQGSHPANKVPTWTDLLPERLGISVLLLAPVLKMALFPQTQLHLWRREHKAAYF